MRFYSVGVLLLSAIAVASQCCAEEKSVETESSFLLSASQSDLPKYFPGYLGNGYVSTLTGARGTEGTRAYMVAFMDYSKGDTSRPAAVPGWTEIDFNAGASDTGRTWLNRAQLDSEHIQNYRQTLNLHDAELTTNYRYKDRELQTGIEVTTFVSEASQHLGATRLTITPDFDGVVRLSFALNLWAAHQPRLDLAELSGTDMEEALAANGLALEPVAPATVDRAALWYPGHTLVAVAEADTKTLAMKLEGAAENGLSMAQAATIELPAGVQPEEVSVYRSQYRLALNFKIAVKRGRHYTFTKYVAFSRASWGGGAAADLELAQQARTTGFDALLRAHQAAWHNLWRSDIEIDGDLRAQQVVHSELYYLLASSTADTAWPIGACAMTPGYLGHVFWDADTWVLPAILMLHPERAKSLAMFRARTLAAAQRRAQARHFEGAMYPWESDPEYGTEQTPHFAQILGETEIHVNSDIALAQWQYYLATLDRRWLREYGWPVLLNVAKFWVSRVTYNTNEKRYEVLHVNSVDEGFNDIPNDTFTNAGAAAALRAAVRAASAVGETADPRWSEIADGLYIPLAADHSRHLPFDPSVNSNGEGFGGGPIPLLYLPSLDLPMTDTLRRGDYDFAIRPVPRADVGAVSMGLAPVSIAASTIGDVSEASSWFSANFSGDTLKPPFNVRTETAENLTGYFVTAAGGYLQNLIFGFAGLRIREEGLVEAYAPVLPDRWRSLTLRNIDFRGRHLDMVIARDGHGTVRLTRKTH